MARAVWSGTISFGLVSVPVRLYPATRRKDVRFHEIDRISGQRVRHQKVIDVPAPTPTLPGERGREIAARGEDDLEPQQSRGQRRMGSCQQPPGSDSVRPMPQSVSAGDVVKGFEVARDRYVTVDWDELDELAPERPRAIDVEQFVAAAAVDPIYFDVSYYVVPDRDYVRAYGVLV